ncbi:hypothetical protein LCGC14_1328700 [marine sediment metagenome]|uniref:Uncharacterized protein n=1 Tax=marine sediment metagenome TaxID=412755 RepID=A0A0F9NJR2_9ZZZZ
MTGKCKLCNKKNLYSIMKKNKLGYYMCKKCENIYKYFLKIISVYHGRRDIIFKMLGLTNNFKKGYRRVRKDTKYPKRNCHLCNDNHTHGYAYFVRTECWFICGVCDPYLIYFISSMTNSSSRSLFRRIEDYIHSHQQDVDIDKSFHPKKKYIPKSPLYHTGGVVYTGGYPTEIGMNELIDELEDD